MAGMPKKGDVVRQKVTPIEGEVISYQVDQETGRVQVLVEWLNEEGEISMRYFDASEIEIVASA